MFTFILFYGLSSKLLSSRCSLLWHKFDFSKLFRVTWEIARVVYLRAMSSLSHVFSCRREKGKTSFICHKDLSRGGVTGALKITAENINMTRVGLPRNLHEMLEVHWGFAVPLTVFITWLIDFRVVYNRVHVKQSLKSSVSFTLLTFLFYNKFPIIHQTKAFA